MKRDKMSSRVAPRLLASLVIANEGKGTGRMRHLGWGEAAVELRGFAAFEATSASVADCRAEPIHVS
eukprot:scaffold315462_cov15-Tisochrysis_lutea.AAC.1